MFDNNIPFWRHLSSIFNVHGASRGRIQKTILMDIFFGLVIVANGVMMGLTTQGVVDESSEEAEIFELVPWRFLMVLSDNSSLSQWL